MNLNCNWKTPCNQSRPTLAFQLFEQFDVTTLMDKICMEKTVNNNEIYRIHTNSI